MDALQDGSLDQALSLPDHADFWSLLAPLMRLAMQGKVRFGAPEQGKVVGREQFIIELRPMPEPRQSFGSPPRLLRLYLAEPDATPDVLVGLHLATKPHGEDIDHEQDGSIAEAERRAHNWASGGQAAC